jgi:hypothetical protein
MYIFRRYITKNGRRIYPKNGHKAFKIWIDDEKVSKSMKKSK